MGGTRHPAPGALHESGSEASTESNWGGMSSDI